MEEKVKGVTLTDAEKIERLSSENSQLRELLGNYELQLRKASNALALERIKLLFKVVENDLRFPEDIVKKAVTEITESFGFNDNEPESENKPEE